MAFGLNIRSVIPLPELVPEGDGSDVIIRLRTSHDRLFNEEGAPPASAQIFSLDSVCGRFQIVNGSEIIADPRFPLDDRHLGFFLLERVIVALLYQRGVSVFHASTVSINGKAVAFMGPPHAGKTAITSYCADLGHPVIDDDILALSLTGNSPVVLPGYPMIKVWPDLLKDRNIPLNHVVLQFPGQEKRVFPLADHHTTGPLPLEAVYIIEKRDSAAIDTLPTGKAVKALMSCWYGLLYHEELFDMAGGYSQAFAQSVGLTKTTRVCQLYRSRDLSAIPELVRMVKDDIKT